MDYIKKVNSAALSVGEELRSFGVALLAATLVFTSFYGFYAFGLETSPESLTVTVQDSITFTTDVSAFGNLTPGTPVYATTTIRVTTNATNGFNLKLEGDEKATGNTVMDHDSFPAVGIADQTEWNAGAATSSGGNGVIESGLLSSGEVLAFRMMSASGSADVLSTTCWGADDSVGTALWAGIASTTGDEIIGQSDEYTASARVNTSLYRLDVPAGQQTGNYSGGITYTATASL